MAKMGKDSARPLKRKSKREDVMPLEPANYKIIVAGIGVIILGYIALSMSPWDGFMPLTVAPILLVLGYCVLIPFGIIYRRRPKALPPEPVPPGT